MNKCLNTENSESQDTHFSCETDRQLAQRGCEIIILGDVQKLSRQGKKLQVVLLEHRVSDQVTSKGSIQSQPVCGSGPVALK